MNLKKSILGYRKGSPYEDDPYIDIFSPDGLIDMSDTRKDLIGIDEYGNQTFMKAGRKEPYQFAGSMVREIPLGEMASGGLTASKAHEMLRDGTAHGKKLTAKQKRYFGMIYGNSKKQFGGPKGYIPQAAGDLRSNAGIPSSQQMQLNVQKDYAGFPIYKDLKNTKALKQMVEYNNPFSGIENDTTSYSVYANMLRENGRPDIAFDTSVKRAYYVPEENRIYGSDQSDILPEMAHSQQFSEDYRRYQKMGKVDNIKYPRDYDGNAPDATYTDSSTIEYDAHTVRSPFLSRQFSKGQKDAYANELQGIEDMKKYALPIKYSGGYTGNPYMQNGGTLQNIYKKYPGLQVMGDVTLKADTTFTRDRTGQGSIEYFSPTQDSVRYNTGYTVGHPKLGTHGILYDPRSNNEQSIALDMLHGMRTASPEYARQREVLKQSLLKNFAGDMQGMDDNGIDNNVDGIIRNLMFEGTPQQMKDARYWDRANEVYLKDPQAKQAFDSLRSQIRGSKRKRGGSMQQGGNPYQEQALDFLFEEDEVAPPEQQQQQNSEEMDVREYELTKREQQLMDDEQYNQALMIAMQAGENPYGMQSGAGGAGYSLGKYTTEKIDNKAAYSYNFLLKKGYTPEVAAGIVANIKHESNFNPGAVGDQGKARGLAQWHPDRYSRLNKQFDLNSLEGSLEALHYELQTSEKDSYNKIKGARTPEEAALLVDRYYERSAGLSTGRRINTSKNIYNTFINE